MAHSKLSLFLGVLMLITAGAFIAGLEAQDTENSGVQEFITAAQEFVKLGKIEKAIEIYERIVIAAPEDDESRVQLATLYIRINQHEKAAQTYHELLETDPENIEYQDALVSSLQTAGKVHEALEHAQIYIQTQPEVGVHYVRLARLYEADGNETAAIANYKKAIELGHSDKQTYLKLARLHFFNEDIDAAEIALKKAILSATSASERQNVEQQLISFYRYHGNLEEKLQKAEDDGTITFEMQKARAEYFYKIGELERALDAYKRARDMATDSYQTERIFAELLKVYVALGKIESAVDAYETQVNSNTDDKAPAYIISSGIVARSDVENARDTLTLMSAFKSQDKLEALKRYYVYEGKLGKNRDNPVALRILAKIYWDEKEYQKSAEMYEALGKTESNDVRYLYHAAAALKKNKQPELATAMLKQAKGALVSHSEKDNVWFLGRLATICIENGMSEPAIELAKSAIDKDDNDSGIQGTLREILAKSYHQTKRYGEAFDVYQEMASKTSRLDTRNRARKAIREIAIEGKLYEKWIPEQLKRVEMNPNASNTILKLAESYEATDQIKQAIQQYQRLTELQPENSRWYIKLGELFQKVERPIDKVIESNALSLDGDGSFVEIVDSELINNISEQVTISAWIRPTDFLNTYTAVFFKGDKRLPDISHRQFTLWLFDEGRLIFNVSPGGKRQKFIWSPPNAIEKNKWYQVAGTIDAKENIMKFYINGYEVGRNDFKQAKTLRKTTLPFRIGSSHEEEWWEHASFVGQIDEMRLWNVARTEQQIRADMNRHLKGDEPGLIGYWKFDEETDGRISDTSPFNHHGKLIGEAKLEPYSRTVYKAIGPEQLALSKAAYEKAIELRPDVDTPYMLLANLYIKQNLIADAEAVYMRALDAPFRQDTHNSLIWAIYELYADEGQAHKLVATLEKIAPKMQESVVMYEILGDLYNKTGDSDKAEIANAKWLELRQKEVNGQRAHYQRRFAEELLEKGLFPETALKYAKRALQGNTGTSYYYVMTLGHASIANELYEDALRNYKYALSVISANSSLDYFWKQIAEASKNANDKERYIQMLDRLNNSIPPEYPSFVPITE